MVSSLNVMVVVLCVIPTVRKPSLSTSAARRASRQTPTRTTPSHATPTHTTPVSTRRESASSGGRTPTSSRKLSELSIEELEKELRARTGRARKKDSITKRDEERSQARKSQQALEERVLGELLSGSNHAWTEQQIKEKRKEAKIKAKAKATAVEEHAAELKRIEMKEKVIAATHDGAWDLTPASPPPSTPGATAIAAAKALLRTPATPTQTPAEGKKRSSYGGAVANARVTPVTTSAADRTPTAEAWADDDPSAIPATPSTPPQVVKVAETAAPLSTGPVPDDGLIHVDVPLNGRKLGFTIAGDSLGRSHIKIIKPDSVLETDSPALPGDTIQSVHGQDLARADHRDVVCALKACMSVGRIVMTLMRNARASPTPASPPNMIVNGSSSAPVTPAAAQTAAAPTLPTAFETTADMRAVVMHKTPQALKNGLEGFGFTVVSYKDGIYIFKLDGAQRYATTETLQLGDQVRW